MYSRIFVLEFNCPSSLVLACISLQCPVLSKSSSSGFRLSSHDPWLAYCPRSFICIFLVSSGSRLSRWPAVVGVWNVGLHLSLSVRVSVSPCSVPSHPSGPNCLHNWDPTPWSYTKASARWESNSSHSAQNDRSSSSPAPPPWNTGTSVTCRSSPAALSSPATVNHEKLSMSCGHRYYSGSLRGSARDFARRYGRRGTWSFLEASARPSSLGGYRSRGQEWGLQKLSG